VTRWLKHEGDMVQLDAGRFLFGFNVQLGLKKEMELGDVFAVYRRDEENMPGSRREVKSAKEEGVEFHWLTAPVQFIGDEEGKLQAIGCVRMELGEPDKDGRDAARGIDDYLRRLPRGGDEGAGVVAAERGRG
jgi:hypothetical protein